MVDQSEVQGDVVEEYDDNVRQYVEYIQLETQSIAHQQIVNRTGVISILQVPPSTILTIKLAPS